MSEALVIWYWLPIERRYALHDVAFPPSELDAACDCARELSRDFHGPVDVMHRVIEPGKAATEVLAAAYKCGREVKRIAA